MLVLMHGYANIPLQSCAVTVCFVQVRTNHERLIRLSEDAKERDYPLQLSSTSNWLCSGDL